MDRSAHPYVRTVAALGAAFLLCTAAAAAPSLSRPPAATPADTAAQLAAPYADQARAAADRSDWTAASRWIRQGLELDPASSDLLLLRARAGRAQGLPFARALADCAAALRADRWRLWAADDALVERCDLLILSRQAATASRELAAARTRSALVAQPRLAAIAARALEQQGERAQAFALIDDALRIHADDVLLMGESYRMGRMGASAHRWIERFDDGSPAFAEALFWYLRSLPPSAERADRISRYLTLGGGKAMVFAWGLEGRLAAGLDETAAERERSTWVEAYLAFAGPRDLDAATVLATLCPSTGPAGIRLRAALAGGSFEGLRDHNLDGLAEERLAFTDGRPVWWRLDANQDGLDEFSLVWESGVPSRVEREDLDRRVTAWYSAYPDLARLETRTADGASVLVLPEGRWELPCVEFPAALPAQALEWLPALRPPVRNAALDPSAFRSEAAAEYDYRSVAGTLVLWRESLLSDGAPLVSRDDSDGDGVFDHVVWYADGMPRLGFRDLENAGDFSALEIYRAGQLAEVIHDDQLRAVSYRKDLSLNRSSWDLDRNGLIDVKEYRDVNNRFMQRFATRLDGSFDLLAADGRVIAVSLPSLSLR